VVIAIAGIAVYYYDAYHKLTFQLSGVSLGNTSLTSIQTIFAITINNPNLLPIYVPSGNFQIYINSQYLGQGTFGSMTIGGNSQDQINVPVTFSATDTPSVIYGILTGGGSVSVTIQGSANLVLFNVPFNSTIYNVNFK
jgi:LEA14-like dessication related protein